MLHLLCNNVRVGCTLSTADYGVIGSSANSVVNRSGSLDEIKAEI